MAKLSLMDGAIRTAGGVVDEVKHALPGGHGPPPVPQELVPPEEPPAPLRDFSHRKIKQITDELHDAVPYLEKAGYVLDSLSVDIGMPPKVVPRFTVREEIDEATKDAVLAESKEHRLAHLILIAVLKTAPLRRAVRVGSLAFRELEIHCGAIPKIRLVFF
ncbi:MAG: hypothetical protein HN742_07930 [Lentisphaerae bacterium]|jgi:hypothetical protein|nr:hypothetical protein [Lentisphaerota bacterium]MBT4817882.1 hypothetical protein [Lentisphaerota bacterium]MBT5604729.1 hypothetical protein [Lentisphaerota bacterium]MBT7058097.1 hypothetical protein [Lentisphaerota bacterium]MBT7841785.1 hypothetical protein [Lentisphaerota bacterium]